MDIQLKGIYVSEKMSEETTAFKANLYINNVKAGTADNEGRGGTTFYRADDERGRQLIIEAEEWCKRLPPMILDGFDDKEKFTLPMNLEHYIDNLVTEHLKQKNQMAFQRKMEKAMGDGIVFGLPDQQYRVWGFRVPLATVLLSQAGIDKLRELIHKRIIPSMKEGEKILNTNIPQEIVKMLGIDATKIVEQKVTTLPAGKRLQDEQQESKAVRKRGR